MNYKLSSRKTYGKFSRFEGNQHIASDYALEKILKLVETLKVRNVLELGLGIGSISDAILEFSKIKNLNINYTGTEANEFCLDALKKNVTSYSSINLYDSLDKIIKNNFYDFIILDGYDSSLEQIKHYCTKNALIFIEGGRADQIQKIKNVFPHTYSSEIISMRRPPINGPFQRKWSGGGTLLAVNPTASQRLFIFTEKIKTYLKRRLRKFVK